MSVSVQKMSQTDAMVLCGLEVHTNIEVGNKKCPYQVFCIRLVGPFIISNLEVFRGQLLGVR